MMGHDPHARLTRLVAADELFAAEQLCGRMVEEGADRLFWKMQSGYVCFLASSDDEARFERAPRHFEDILQRRPDEWAARFWHAYVSLLLLDEREAAARALRSIPIGVPEHPYALIVLAGMGDDDAQAAPLLRAALRSQPGNLRALHALAQIELGQGRSAAGLEVLRILLHAEPFRETRYGIMNLYINQVLTQAEHAERVKAEASRQVAAA